MIGQRRRPSRPACKAYSADAAAAHFINATLAKAIEGRDALGVPAAHEAMLARGSSRPPSRPWILPCGI